MVKDIKRDGGASERAYLEAEQADFTRESVRRGDIKEAEKAILNYEKNGSPNYTADSKIAYPWDAWIEAARRLDRENYSGFSDLIRKLIDIGEERDAGEDIEVAA